MRNRSRRPGAECARALSFEMSRWSGGEPCNVLVVVVVVQYSTYSNVHMSRCGGALLAVATLLASAISPVTDLPSPESPPWSPVSVPVRCWGVATAIPRESRVYIRASEYVCACIPTVGRFYELMSRPSTDSSHQSGLFD